MNSALGTRRCRVAIQATWVGIALASCTMSEHLPAHPPASAIGDFPKDPMISVVSVSGAWHVALRTAPDQPPTQGTSTADLRITDVAGYPATGLSVTVTPWMPAMGHGSDQQTGVTPMELGRYVVDNVDLTMAGDWSLKLALSHSGTQDEAELPIHVL